MQCRYVTALLVVELNPRLLEFLIREQYKNERDYTMVHITNPWKLGD